MSNRELGLRQTQILIKTKPIRRRKVPPAVLLLSSNLQLNSNITGGTILLLIVFVLISDCVRRRLSSITHVGYRRQRGMSTDSPKLIVGSEGRVPTPQS